MAACLQASVEGVADPEHVQSSAGAMAGVASPYSLSQASHEQPMAFGPRAAALQELPCAMPAEAPAKLPVAHQNLPSAVPGGAPAKLPTALQGLPSAVPVEVPAQAPAKLPAAALPAAAHAGAHLDDQARVQVLSGLFETSSEGHSQAQKHEQVS